jgi:hypothetical protein
MTRIQSGVLLGLLVGLGFGLGGFFLSAHGGQAMGSVLFCAVPFAAGFAVALVTKPKEGLLAAAILTLIGSLVILLFTQLEGPLCCIVSLPLLLICMSIGVGLGSAFNHLVKSLPFSRSLKILVLLILPLTLQASDLIEQPNLFAARKETFTDSILLKASPETIWNQIVAIDKITVPKPWPMYVGLYQPVHCTISAKCLGADRTCYFTKGEIYERIDAWQPPNYMHMKILKSTMPGRPWMGYIDASYRLIARGQYTELQRTTTITSRLAPTWYWQTCEGIGVSTEHRYLFAEIKKRVEQI